MHFDSCFTYLHTWQFAGAAEFAETAEFVCNVNSQRVACCCRTLNVNQNVHWLPGSVAWQQGLVAKCASVASGEDLERISLFSGAAAGPRIGSPSLSLESWVGGDG